MVSVMRPAVCALLCGTISQLCHCSGISERNHRTNSVSGRHIMDQLDGDQAQ
jgi:hypothetical protein